MMGEVIRVSGRGPDVGDLLKEAMLSQRFADVALCCSGGQRFLAHRLVLSAASPYLQEVLLAHGRAAGYNEPITMILAEVEGAELAAILGLVYTGSATIQKSRLEAFTRAAETLHVRIPPFVGPSGTADPPAATYVDPPPYRRLSTPAPSRLHRDLDDGDGDDDDDDDDDDDYCSLDHVKIEGTSKFEGARYLRREKYPRCEGRYDRSSWHRDSRFGSSAEADFRRDDNPMSFGVFDLGVNNPFTDKARKVLYEKRINFESADKFERKDYHENVDKSENIHLDEIDSVATDRRWLVDNSTISLSIDSSLLEHPTTLRFGSVSGDENDYFQVGTGASASNFVRVFAPPVDRRDVPLTTNVDSDNLEGVRRRDGLASSLSPDPRPPILKSFETRNYDRGVRSMGVRPIVDSGRSLPNSPSTCATVTSEIVPNVASSIAIVAGNNEETCLENCCGWRRPRRHVANRVPASPWCQLARPAHHSPKTRSVLLCGSRDASVETAGAPLGWTESVPSGERRPSPFAPLSAIRIEDRGSDTGIGAIYDFKVPKTREISSKIDDESVGSVEVQIPRPNFYEARAPPPFIFATEGISRTRTEGSTRTSSSNRAVVGRDLEPLPTRITAPRRQPSPVGISENTISASTGTAITVLDNNANTNNNDPPTCDLRTSPRIQLSHPVSRLCDISRTTDDVSTIPTNSNNRDHLSRIKNPLSTKLTILGDVENNNRDDVPSFRAKTIFSASHADIIPKNDDNNNEARIEEDGIEITGTGSGGETVGGGNEEHRCDQCGKTFVTRASLKVHGRTHSGEKPFRCNDCGKEFSQLRNYKYHRSVHEGTREFAATCPECGKYFNDRGYLSSHMKIHRNRKEYGCAECGKSFNQRVAYNMHVRIHTGVKPHQCDQCGKAFSRKMLLKQHLRTHSGERPYQCQICHKAFADRSNMTLHTRLHSGLKPYQCTLCSKAFTKKHHLKTHLNYHTGTKPYSCPNCSLRFSQSSNMRTHYKKCSTINGGGGTSQRSPTIRTNDTEEKTSSIGASIPINDSKTPANGANRAANCVLTPPSSDQESSILAVSPILAQERLARSISRGFVNEITNKVVVGAVPATNTIPGT